MRKTLRYKIVWVPLFFALTVILSPVGLIHAEDTSSIGVITGERSAQLLAQAIPLPPPPPPPPPPTTPSAPATPQASGATPAANPGAGFPVPPQRFRPLAGIPGLTNVENLTIPGLINLLYSLVIVVGALAAVLKITWAGFQYVGADIITSKEEAKNDIWSSLVGLLIILSTVLILKTIFGQVSLDPFAATPGFNLSGSPITPSPAITSTPSTPSGASTPVIPGSSPTTSTFLIAP